MYRCTKREDSFCTQFKIDLAGKIRDLVYGRRVVHCEHSSDFFHALAKVSFEGQSWKTPAIE